MVMQLSTEFSSSRELEDERLSVCSLLKELDEREASAYDAEIREIIRNQNIYRGIREVEASKIWVDQDGIRRWAGKTLAESYARFLSLRAARLKPEQNPAEALSRELNADEVVEQDGNLSLPDDEIANLLVTMVKEFASQCFLDRQNGLDCYLSLRIRHGALSGQMRASLEEEKIITLQREPGSGDYAPNQFWIDRLSTRDAEMALRVDTRLREFSREFDNVIEGFSKEYVQIQTETKKSGLFSPVLLPAKVLLAVEDIHSETTFDSFLDICFQIFWESIEVSLAAVRDYIIDHLGPQVDKIFLMLLSDIDSLTAGHATPELDNAIRNAQTKTRHAIEQVKDWFRQPKPLQPTIISFRQLIEISLEAVRRMYRDFDPQVSYDLGDLPSFVQLQKFTDIFFILLDNVRKHSGIRAGLSIEIKASQVGNNLAIEFRNNIAPGIRNEETEARVQEIQAKIAEGAYQRAVSSEGGTGLMKIRNIVGADPEVVSALDFGFDGSERFLVRLNLPSTITSVPTLEDQA
jgi:hypothetical protein